MKNKKEIRASAFFESDVEESVSMIMPILTDCDVDEDFSEGVEKIKDEIPILPLRNMVLFPGVAMPVIVGRSKSLNLIKKFADKRTLIGVVCQRDASTEDPRREDLYDIGSIADILRVLDMPDGSTTIILQGKKRFRLHDLTGDEPYLSGRIELLDDGKPAKNDKEFNALVGAVKDLMVKILLTSSEPQRELIFSLKNNRNALYTINFGCANLLTNIAERQLLLMTDDLKARAYKLMTFLNREFQLLELKASIQMKTQEDLDKQQKEYFLQQQLKTIQEELGGNSSDRDIQDLKDKAYIKKWPANVAEAFDKELAKLQRLHPQSPDYSVQMQYVQTIVNLPWETYSADNFNLNHARKVLDRDHYGLEKVKERIIEHLAVLKLKKDMKSFLTGRLFSRKGADSTVMSEKSAASVCRTRRKRTATSSIILQSLCRKERLSQVR